VAPIPFRLISFKASKTGVSSCTDGMASPRRITSQMGTSSLSPKYPAGSIAMKIPLLEIPELNQSHGKSVPQGQHGCGAGGRGQPHGAGFPGNPRIDGQIAVPGQGRIGLSREGDDPCADVSQAGENDVELSGFAAVGQGQDDVLAADHSQVSVHGFHGMKKQGRGAGAAERGHNFSAHDPRFADSRNNDSPSAPVNPLNRDSEGLLDVVHQWRIPSASILNTPAAISRISLASMFSITCGEFVSRSSPCGPGP